MATPKTVTDGSSDLDEAVLNLFLRAGKLQVKVNYGTIKFVAATNTPTIDATFDSDGEVITADLAYDAAGNITITLSGFTAIAVGLLTIYSNASTNIGNVLFRPGSTTSGIMRYIGTAAGEAAVDPDGDIYVQFLIIGV